MKPIGGHAARRLGETNVVDERALHEVHIRLFEPNDQRFDEGFVLVELRTENMRHGREVGKQIDKAVQVTPELDDGVLWQRTHQRRPEQPKLRLAESWREPLLDALPTQ